jgi:hypothetical protein
MPAKKTRPAKKKPATKKVVEVKETNLYDQIQVIKVEGMTVYKYKENTSLSLDKIKRYVDAESN